MSRTVYDIADITKGMRDKRKKLFALLFALFGIFGLSSVLVPAFVTSASVSPLKVGEPLRYEIVRIVGGETDGNTDSETGEETEGENNGEEAESNTDSEGGRAFVYVVTGSILNDGKKAVNGVMITVRFRLDDDGITEKLVYVGTLAAGEERDIAEVIRLPKKVARSIGYIISPNLESDAPSWISGLFGTLTVLTGIAAVILFCVRKASTGATASATGAVGDNSAAVIKRATDVFGGSDKKDGGGDDEEGMRFAPSYEEAYALVDDVAFADALFLLEEPEKPELSAKYDELIGKLNEKYGCGFSRKRRGADCSCELEEYFWACVEKVAGDSGFDYTSIDWRACLKDAYDKGQVETESAETGLFCRLYASSGLYKEIWDYSDSYMTFHSALAALRREEDISDPFTEFISERAADVEELFSDVDRAAQIVDDGFFPNNDEFCKTAEQLTEEVSDRFAEGNEDAIKWFGASAVKHVAEKAKGLSCFDGKDPSADECIEWIISNGVSASSHNATLVFYRLYASGKFKKNFREELWSIHDDFTDDIIRRGGRK